MKIAKLFNPKLYLRKNKKLIGILAKSVLPYNFIVDRMIQSVSFEDLKKLNGVKINFFEIVPQEYRLWVNKYFPDWKRIFRNIEHKKLFELYSTFKILNINSDDVYLDAAGGRYTYINAVNCKRKVMHDLKFAEQFKSYIDNDVELLECSAAHLKLCDESVDKISCHHSFEHFQGSVDINFIREVQRTLRPGGKCCIIQIFIADYYVEITSDFTFDLKFDDRARQIIDPTAVITGQGNGSFARVYDLNSFQKRILNNIDTTKFTVSISELRLNGNILPDLSLACHKHVTAVNRPFRIMTIEHVM